MGYPLPIPGQFQLQQAEVPWRHLFSQPTKLTVKTLELELRLRPQRLAGPDDGWKWLGWLALGRWQMKIREPKKIGEFHQKKECIMGYKHDIWSMAVKMGDVPLRRSPGQFEEGRPYGWISWCPPARKKARGNTTAEAKEAQATTHLTSAQLILIGC